VGTLQLTHTHTCGSSSSPSSSKKPEDEDQMKKDLLVTISFFSSSQHLFSGFRLVARQNHKSKEREHVRGGGKVD